MESTLRTHAGLRSAVAQEISCITLGHIGHAEADQDATQFNLKPDGICELIEAVK